MQRATSRAIPGAVTPIGFHSQATRVVTSQAARLRDQAVNDDVYGPGESPAQLVLKIAGNVVGGTLMLTGLLVLPHILAGLLN